MNEQTFKYLSENVSNMYSTEEIDVLDDDCQVLIDVINIENEEIEIWVPISDAEEYKKDRKAYISNHLELLDGYGIRQKKLLVDHEGNPL